MVDSEKYFPTRFLTGDDIKPNQNAVIIDVKEEDVGPDDDQSQVLVVYFKDVDKGLRVNKTINDAIVDLAGTRMTEKWVNTTVGLIEMKQPFKGKIYNVVRVVPPHRKK